jgi:murein DD-endopeptidase MepM/ murein hydrolase activator NlpD
MARMLRYMKALAAAFRFTIGSLYIVAAAYSLLCILSLTGYGGAHLRAMGKTGSLMPDIAGFQSSLSRGFHTTARSLEGHVSSLAQIPAATFNYLANPSVLNPLIRPVAHTDIPTIDVSAPVQLAQTTPAQATQAASTHVSAPPVPASETPQWPIHGAVTTLFGASDWPYERIHTGIDISDGRRSGVTPVHPFRSGTVAQVIHSSVGLGNHVVVDHGGGLISVYGHLASIAVQPGQSVGQDTVLGYEGTTGASTGTHLHFEIRINGTPVNPKLYIVGNP